MQRLHPDAAQRDGAADLLGLLTPLVKALSSDLAVECTLLAMQVFGGHGYIRENGVEQHLRDVRIVGLYEGTNGVQAMDLLGRKVLADQGRQMGAFLDMAGAFADVGSKDGANDILGELIAVESESTYVLTETQGLVAVPTRRITRIAVRAYRPPGGLLIVRAGPLTRGVEGSQMKELRSRARYPQGLPGSFIGNGLPTVSSCASRPRASSCIPSASPIL